MSLSSGMSKEQLRKMFFLPNDKKALESIAMVNEEKCRIGKKETRAFYIPLMRPESGIKPKLLNENSFKAWLSMNKGKIGTLKGEEKPAKVGSKEVCVHNIYVNCGIDKMKMHKACKGM